MSNIDFSSWAFLRSVLFEGETILAWRDSRGAEVIGDLDVARLLWLADPHSIRRTILSYRGDLGAVSEHELTRGGRWSVGYFLTEPQAMFIAGKSRGRSGVAQRLAAVYSAVRQGSGGPIQTQDAVIADLLVELRALRGGSNVLPQ